MEAIKCLKLNYISYSININQKNIKGFNASSGMPAALHPSDTGPGIILCLLSACIVIFAADQLCARGSATHEENGHNEESFWNS